jgi:hypothetical protein
MARRDGWQNPPKVFISTYFFISLLKTSEVFGAGTDMGISSFGDQDFQSFEGRLWLHGRFGNEEQGAQAPMQFGYGASIHFLYDNYSGGYPGAQGVLWSQGGADLGLRIKWGSFSIGLGSTATVLGVGVANIDSPKDPQVSLDVGAGLFWAVRFARTVDIGLGLSTLNFFSSMTNKQLRTFLGGASLHFEKIAFAVDLVYYPNSLSVLDIKAGSEIILLANKLVLRLGTQVNGLYSLEPSVGVSYYLNQFKFTYALNYNLTTLGFGNHQIGFSLYLPKVN